jgi:hypothetical protein
MGISSKIDMELLWNVFEMRGIGKGLSETEASGLKKILEEKGDRKRLEIINEAINNYKLDVETLWDNFRTEGIGKRGLSEMEAYKLEKLLEKKGDSEKLNAISKALNNYENRMNKNKKIERFEEVNNIKRWGCIYIKHL